MKYVFLCVLMLALLCSAEVKRAKVTLQSVSVNPASASITISNSQQFTATANYSNGTHTVVTTSSTWSSSLTSVATVGASTGLATGVAAGTSTIKATYSGKSASAALTVTSGPPPPGTTVVDFDNPGCPNGNSGQSLTGTFQGINWGSSPWDCEVAGSPTDTTTSASWNVSVTQATFAFVTPSVLNSLKAGTSSGSGTYSISTDAGEQISVPLTSGNPVFLINTGFSKTATIVTISFTGGWTVETDDITYTTPPVSSCNPHFVSLTWTDSDQVTFNVYRSASNGGPYSSIATGLSTTSATDTNTPAGTYYYVVTAVDGSGAESAYSLQASAVVPCQ